MKKKDQRFFTDEQLRIAVAKTYSMAGLLRELQVPKVGSRYRSAKKRIQNLGLDTSHWTGQAYLKGKPNPHVTRRPLEEILVEQSNYSDMAKLKSRLIREGLLLYKCSNPKCQLTADWLGEPLVLVLDHINGHHNDNRLENLRLLCPNCNSQTPTFCSRNRANKKPAPTCIDCGKPKSHSGIRCPSCARKVRAYNRRKTSNKNEIHKCLDCNKDISAKAVRCKSCTVRRQPTKIQWPTLKALLHRLKLSSCVAVARELGVSDKAVKKHIRMEQRKLAEQAEKQQS